ncbi:MAG: GH1 family beta-glucosidase [Myxococcota bacterium]
MSALPDDFVWGAATSSFQIEGAATAGGRGESIWDRFCEEPGKIADGSNAVVACDHYHRYRDDIALMKELGLGGYRFSVAWPRVQPHGHGSATEAGLDFYERLVDGLLESGIRPYCTLYHWDLPQALQDVGGWGARDICDRFADYAEIMVDRLGDRLKNWFTFNEPWCISHLGHHVGEQAPGVKDPAMALTVAHHVNLAHGLAVPRLRELCSDGELGIVHNLVPAYPASRSAADQSAAQWFDGFFNRWYLDPIFGRGYPSDTLRHYGELGLLDPAAPSFIQPGDLETIAAPIDVLGINYYSRAISRGPEEANLPREVFEPAQKDRTDMGWEVFPRGLEDLLVRVHEDYAPSTLMVTECGVAYSDGPDGDRTINDQKRIEFLRAHLVSCRRAIERGVPLKGYFAWSLMDNFEWAHGYKMRFGLVWVDFNTLDRIPKQSFHWYRDVIAAGGV